MNKQSQRQYLIWGSIAVVALLGIGLIAFLIGRLSLNVATAADTPTPVVTPTNTPLPTSTPAQKTIRVFLPSVRKSDFTPPHRP